jgi:Tfp pilus assembly protein PilE
MVVLGVIASIAIPSFLGSRNNSYDKEAQSSIDNVLKAAKFHYQSQGDFSDASSAQCGDSTKLAADLQKLEPNVDVVASSVSSTNSQIVSVQAVQTWDSTGGLLGCQGFYAVAFSSSGSCWAARIILEGKFLASGSVSPVVVNAQLNTSNSAIATWSALAVNGNAFGVLKPQTSAADGDNTNGLVAIKTACKAKTHSTGLATTSSNYIAPSQFYTSWRDIVSGGTASASSSSSSSSSACTTGGTCIVGDTGPGGGVVFYVQSSGGTFTSTGSACTPNCKYLEAAPVSWGNGITVAGGETSGTATRDPVLKWCSDTTTQLNATGTVIGTGLANTNLMNGCTSGAGFHSRAYRGGGLSDWYLPSKNEMLQMFRYNYRQTPPVSLSMTDLDNYWSSTESGSWAIRTDVNPACGDNGCQYSQNKTQPHSVRPVRAFG